MMRSTALTILLTLAMCLHAKQQVAKDITGVHDSMDKLVDNLVDALFEWALRAQPLHWADLEGTSLASPASHLVLRNALQTANFWSPSVQSSNMVFGRLPSMPSKKVEGFRNLQGHSWRALGKGKSQIPQRVEFSKGLEDQEQSMKGELLQLKREIESLHWEKAEQKDMERKQEEVEEEEQWEAEDRGEEVPGEPRKVKGELGTAWDDAHISHHVTSTRPLILKADTLQQNGNILAEAREWQHKIDVLLKKKVVYDQDWNQQREGKVKEPGQETDPKKTKAKAKVETKAKAREKETVTEAETETAKEKEKEKQPGTESELGQEQAQVQDQNQEKARAKAKEQEKATVKEKGLQTEKTKARSKQKEQEPETDQEQAQEQEQEQEQEQTKEQENAGAKEKDTEMERTKMSAKAKQKEIETNKAKANVKEEHADTFELFHKMEAETQKKVEAGTELEAYCAQLLPDSSRSKKSINAAVFDLETNAIEDFTTLSNLETVHCMVVQDADGIHRYQNQNMKEGLRRLSQADCLVAHNGIGFDLPVLKMLYGFEHPVLLDTLVLSRLMHPDLKNEDNRDERNFSKGLMGSHSLEAWGQRLGVYKGSFGKTSNWTMYSKEMEDYCAQDVTVTESLARHLLDQSSGILKSLKLELEFAMAMKQQEENGFPLDVVLARNLTSTLLNRQAALQDELREVFPPEVVQTATHWWVDSEGKQFPTKKAMLEAGYKAKECFKGDLKTKEIPFNPNSRDQIAARLMEKGWKPKQYEGKRPVISETVLREINNTQSLKLLESLLISKRLGQISDGAQAWLKLERNGRIHGRVNTNGAVSGRCTHQNPNIAQVPAVGVEYGKECRSCFTAPKGKVLVGADASGLELRMLASYLYPIDDGAYAKKLLEGDIHTTNQEAAGLASRGQAKTFIYAFLYGAGDARIGKIVGGSNQAGKRLKEKFMTKIPAIATLTEAITEHIKKDGVLEGLDGRILPCRSPHSALNLLLQSAGAIVMKQALVHFVEEMKGKEYELHANVHDEVQFSCDADKAEEYGQMFVDCIKKAGKTLGVMCELDGEYKVGKSWAETH